MFLLVFIVSCSRTNKNNYNLYFDWLFWHHCSACCVMRVSGKNSADVTTTDSTPRLRQTSMKGSSVSRTCERVTSYRRRSPSGHVVKGSMQSFDRRKSCISLAVRNIWVFPHYKHAYHIFSIFTTVGGETGSLWMCPVLTCEKSDSSFRPVRVSVMFQCHCH